MTILKQSAEVSDPLPSSSQWERLSVVEEKLRLYPQDLYFRECWVDVAEKLGADTLGTLNSIALLNVKPDAVVGRRMNEVLDFVIQHQFRPIAAVGLRLTRHSMRELWRYDWHVYTVDRLAFSTWWYTSTDILLFIVQDVSAQNIMPASVRLTQLKGNAIAERRKPTDMRTVLRSPNRILNFVHVAEEPADIVREVGILMDRTERRNLLSEIARCMGADRSGHIRDQIAQLESRFPEHDLDVAACLQRFENSSVSSAKSAAHVRELIAIGAKISWDEICALLLPTSGTIDRWDFICIACNLLRYEREVPSSEMFSQVEINKWSRAMTEGSIQ